MRQVVVFWGFFLVVVPFGIVALESRLGIAAPLLQGPWVFYSALALLCFVSAVGLLSGITMARFGDGTPLPAACAAKLVVVGPYAYIRNPMAACGIVQGAMIGLLLASPLTIVYSLCGAFVWHFIARPIEEADLVERFGGEYDHYRRSVRCWLPHLRRYRPAETGRR
jgi:protein-S-isoprenylcysteine O-methyltransferase Ste14